MTVRRNGRRRRLMSEEYVSTSVETDQNFNDQGESVSKFESNKRAYAMGADRGCQLKTTDLFPKQLWIITLCGVMLFLVVVGLNVLNGYAPQWQPYIGEASVRAISLSGPGTLASWMLCVTLLTTGLSSLQIFALRQHRCDDYGGTYRVWLIVPPIFFIASVAAIVDFEAIFIHINSVAQLTSVATESLIPMTIKLSVVALLMVRLLFEIRDSKAAFSMLVVAWLTIAISTVLNTRWAENRISSQDLAMIYPNAVLVSAISLMLAHLFYVRFVYLHAHGAIAIKKRTPAIAKTKVAKTKRAAKAETKSTPTTSTVAAKKASTKADSKSKTKKTTRAKTKPAETVTPTSTPVTKTAAKTSAKPTAKSAAPPSPSATSKESSKPKSGTMSDFQTLLKKKQAEKQAAAEGTATTNSAAETPSESKEEDGILNMSKAERRRARKAAKAAKAKRRAA